MKTSFILTALLCVLFLNTHAQTVANSTVKTISSKAAKGELYHYDDSGDTIILTYLIKESKKGKLVETYSFDKATLEFIGSEESMLTVSDENFEKKIPEGGDKLLRVYPNLAGKPKLKLGHIEYGYAGRAIIEHFIVEQELTPKGSAGEKIFYVHHRTEVADNNQVNVLNRARKLNVGDVQLIGIVKDEPLYTKFSSLVISASDLSTKYEQEFDLEYSYRPVCADNLPNGNIAVVLRSLTMNDFPKSNASKGAQAKYNLAPDYHLKYIEFDQEGNIMQDVNLSMEQPESGYYLTLDIVPGEVAGESIVMGTTRPLKLLANMFGKISGPFPTHEEKKNIYFPKADRLFIAKVKNNEAIFSSTHSIDALLQNPISAGGSAIPKDVKSMKMASKKPVPVDFTAVDGVNLINLNIGQDHQQLIQVSDKGEIEANYIFKAPKGRMNNMDLELLTNGQGKLYVFRYHMPSVKPDSPTEEWSKASNQRTCMVFSMDPGMLSMGSPLDITPGASLDVYDPFFFEDANTIVTLGNGKKKEIVLSRVKL